MKIGCGTREDIHTGCKRNSCISQASPNFSTYLSSIIGTIDAISIL